jgi:hypothetical protein
VSKSDAGASPIVPGRYFVFVERQVLEQYQMQQIDAESEEKARAQGLAQFLAGRVAHMSSVQVEPPTARVRPVREKNLRRLADQAQGSAAARPLRTAARFEGPDNEVLEPLGQFPGTHPEAVTRAQARRICQNFDASGHSNHSGRGSTLWVVLEHCAESDVAYNLRAMPGVGYYVERAKPVDDGLALHMAVDTEYGRLRS